MTDILVVDDDHEMRLSLSHLLGKAGYGVTTANDGEAALAVLRNGLSGQKNWSRAWRDPERLRDDEHDRQSSQPPNLETEPGGLRVAVGNPDIKRAEKQEKADPKPVPNLNPIPHQSNKSISSKLRKFPHLAIPAMRWTWASPSLRRCDFCDFQLRANFHLLA